LKQDDADRNLSRKLERLIWQYQASQNLTDDEIQFIQNLAEEEPKIYEEMAAKKKWTYVVKNPERAMKE
jgi:hypothetical protein